MKTFETYRGFVYPWCIDHVGHMNVQSYVGRFDEASWHFVARLGLTPRFLAARQCALVALDQRIAYRREVLQGTLLEVRSTLCEARTKTLRYQHRMLDSECGHEVAQMELLVGYLDKLSRRTTPLPEVVLARARAALAPADGAPQADDVLWAPEQAEPSPSAAPLAAGVQDHGPHG